MEPFIRPIKSFYARLPSLFIACSQPHVVYSAVSPISSSCSGGQSAGNASRRNWSMPAGTRSASFCFTRRSCLSCSGATSAGGRLWWRLSSPSRSLVRIDFMPSCRSSTPLRCFTCKYNSHCNARTAGNVTDSMLLTVCCYVGTTSCGRQYRLRPSVYFIIQIEFHCVFLCRFATLHPQYWTRSVCGRPMPICMERMQELTQWESTSRTRTRSFLWRPTAEVFIRTCCSPAMSGLLPMARYCSYTHLFSRTDPAE